MKSPYSPPYSPYPDRSGYGADADFDEYDARERYGRYGSYGHGPDAYHGDDVDDVDDDGVEDVVTYEDEPIDRRWIWIAGVAGVVLLVAVVCTSVILGGGDSGPVSATVAEPTTSASPSPTASKSPAPTSPRVAPPAALTPETVTTVTPTPSATASPSPTAQAEPTPPTAEAAPAPDPRTVTYTVTGNRQLLDLVTVIYTDQQGALQTDINVALPWTKTIVLDPGVALSSVTATSVTGQLNCAITNAAGATIAAQNSNTIITTCTK